MGRPQPRDFLRKSAVALCLGGCLFVALHSGCSRQEAPSGNQVLRLSQRNEPATLDPHLAALPDEFFIIRALGEGLLTPAPGGGAPLPGMAERWEVSPDGLVYTFTLRPDVRWSNGDPVTAADFVFSIERVLSPALAAPKANLFYALSHAQEFAAGRLHDFAQVGARALDSRRLQLTLAEPTADFLAIVASGPWIPVHPATILKFGRIDERGTAWTRPGNHVGNGPFTLTGWQPNQEITVQRNPASAQAGSVRLSQIRFLAFDNGDSEERAFRAGQLDVTMAVPVSKLAAYADAKPTVLRRQPLQETRYLSLNTTRAPLDDVRVRRALSLALDRVELTEKLLLGGQQPAYNFIPPGLGGYQPAFRLAADAVEARRLLAEAGYPGGRGFPKLEIATWVNSALLEVIQQQWHRELGIEVAVAQHEARTHLAALSAGDYTLALVPAIPDYDGASDLFNQLKTGASANYPHWKNPDFDRLVEAAGRDGTASGRNGAYQAAEKILLKELPLIPLYFNTQNFLIRPAVKNWQTDQRWTRFYRDVSIE